MVRKKISTGALFEEQAKYSRAVVNDNWIIISGTVGIDPATGEIPESAEEQTRAIFRIVEGVLEQAGMSIDDILHCRVFMTDRAYLDDIVTVLAEKFDKVRPANTTVICQLPVPNAKVEIELTGKRQ